MKPDRFELWRLVTCQFKYVVDPRFSFCVLKMSESLCFCWLFPLLLNSYINVKYPVRQKLTRLISQAQSYALRVLYDTYNLRLFCFLETTDQTSSAFVRKLSQVNEKPMIIIIISVCSQMITYKAVKANSWLRYWFPYLNIENRQAIWLWWRSEWAHLYFYNVADMSPCLRCRQFQHLFCSSELCCSGWLFFVYFFTIVLNGIR